MYINVKCFFKLMCCNSECLAKAFLNYIYIHKKYCKMSNNLTRKSCDVFARGATLPRIKEKEIVV